MGEVDLDALGKELCFILKQKKLLGRFSWEGMFLVCYQRALAKPHLHSKIRRQPKHDSYVS